MTYTLEKGLDFNKELMNMICQEEVREGEYGRRQLSD